VKWVPGAPIMDLNASLEAEARPSVGGRLLAQALAQIHCLDVRSLGLAGIRAEVSRRQHVLTMLATYERQWLRRRTWCSPVIAAAFGWMRQNIPDGDEPVRVVHGDASLRNILVDQGRLSAIIDWELWHLGDPAEDLAYCRSDVEQVMRWEDFLSEYNKHGGHGDNVASLRFYGMWKSLRNATMAMNIVRDFDTTKNCDDVRAPWSAYNAYTTHLAVIAGFLLNQQEFQSEKV
jgi:aminoglycoside phosphotransferase (APT) family kinase protein